MTQYRLKQYESLLRKLRQRVFLDPRIEERHLIDKVKQHCIGNWDVRAQKHAEARMSVYFL